MSPIAILIAAWLLVFGYGLVVIGWTNFNGGSLSFAQVFLGRGAGQPSPSSGSGSQQSLPTGTPSNPGLSGLSPIRVK